MCVGKEPKRSVDEKELETFMTKYKQLNDEHDADRAERENDRRKKEDEDCKGGEAIRNAAIRVERPHRKKTRDKYVNPLGFLVKLHERNVECQEQERMEHAECEEKLEACLEAMQAQHAAN
ncbi:hypothetical protein P3T76_014858 [Phytophthora citrophthora]|uniref:Uncharacterized protein n=1 Tax=Phytophthora citrophthora TaxID=4793 RepID=A0AAD9G0A0_9STRA|nr:hypothetical protein P3T76_014858 [Phytophthora citrophthora]